MPVRSAQRQMSHVLGSSSALSCHARPFATRHFQGPTGAWSSLPSRRTCPACRSQSGTFWVSAEGLSEPGLSSNSEARRLLPGLHKVVVIVLPLSLVLLVFGWIFGFVSSLVRIPRMLVGSASYILFCSKSRRVSCWCWFCGGRGKVATASRPRCPHIMAGVNVRLLCLKVSKNTQLRVKGLVS